MVELPDFFPEQKCRATIVISSGFDSRVVSIARDLGDKMGLHLAPTLPKPVRAALRAVLDQFRKPNVEVNALTLRGAVGGEGRFRSLSTGPDQVASLSILHRHRNHKTGWMPRT